MKVTKWDGDATITKDCPANGVIYPDGGWSVTESYHFYWKGTPLELTVFDSGRHPEINVLTWKSWCNSQSWGHKKI